VQILSKSKQILSYSKFHSFRGRDSFILLYYFKYS